MSGIVQNKAVFIHIPKTGGTAIRHAINVPCGHTFYNHFKTDLPAFMFCRNPIDRFISAYNYIKHNELNERDKKDREYLMQFKDINDFAQNSDFVKLLHFKHQINWAVPNSFVGKFENLENDFKSICKTLKIDFKPLKIEKKTVKKDVISLTGKTIRLLKDIYEPDFKLFNYKL